MKPHFKEPDWSNCNFRYEKSCNIDRYPSSLFQVKNQILENPVMIRISCLNHFHTALQVIYAEF